MLKTYVPKTPALLETLTQEQRDAVLQADISKRVQLLSQFCEKSCEQILHQVAEECGLSFLDHFQIAEKADQILRLSLIHKYQCLPITPPEGADKNCLHLVASWPPDADMINWIGIVCDQSIVWYLGAADKIHETIVQNFGVGSESLDAALEGVETETQTVVEEDENAAVIRFVNEIIVRALKDRATDIHFEPQKNSLRIRYRIDGQLIPIKLPENLVKLQSAIISRLKIMANLNISEKRRPQDGRIGFSSNGAVVEIRVSTLPVMDGEAVSLRLLNQSNRPVSLEETGMLERDIAIVHRCLSRPYGIILSTGPTGSGKSTTLISCLRILNKENVRIITVEDPVEQVVPGLNQAQVNSEIGFTFASALRCMLRQDPNIIMVGEIRDKETAEIAISASLTGHLVLSTLHTNDAAGALTRLSDMGIPPFRTISSVEMIMAQRLIRRLCPHCCRPAKVDLKKLKMQMEQLEIPTSEVEYAHLIQEPVGCDQCRNSGYKGQVGIFEILRVSENIRYALLAKKSTLEIKKIALSEGMHTLCQNGWEQVKRGLTTWDEVVKFGVLDGGAEGSNEECAAVEGDAN